MSEHKLGTTLADVIATPPDVQMCEGAEHACVLYQVDPKRWDQRGIVNTCG